MADELQIEEDPDTGNTIACLESPQVWCGPVGENSTFTHRACLDGGVYTYTLQWGDMSDDVIVTGVMLAENESIAYNHTYETEGIYETFFSANVTFPNEIHLSMTTMPVWEIGNETCGSYRTDEPTASPAPSLAPTLFVTSAAAARVGDPLIPLGIIAIASMMLLLLKK